MNSLAIARNIKQTFRRMKSEELQDVKTTGCDQNKLREKFKKHYRVSLLTFHRPEYMQTVAKVEYIIVKVLHGTHFQVNRFEM